MAETTTITRPAPVLEASLTNFLKAIDPLVGQKLNVGAFAPQIAAESQLQQDARTAAAGLGSLTGPDAFKPFMSPYQQEVIDTTLTEFDRQQAIADTARRDAAIRAGAFGGGREGVELAEYQTGSDMDRAMLQANLLQQGFESAAARRQHDLANQQGLAQLVPQLQRADISTLGSVGAVQQAQAQAEEDATREAARQATFLPQENLSRYAGQVAGLMGGYPGQTTQSFVPNPSPLQTAIGAGSALAGIFGALKG